MSVEQINNSTGAAEYLHHDQAGSTRLVTGPTGTVTGKCTHSPDGTPTREGTATTRSATTGKFTNADTGLIYMRAWSYDPATAQFLTVDPLKALSGEPYSFSEDNPLNRRDATGLSSLKALGITFGALTSLASGKDTNHYRVHEDRGEMNNEHSTALPETGLNDICEVRRYRRPTERWVTMFGGIVIALATAIPLATYLAAHGKQVGEATLVVALLCILYVAVFVGYFFLGGGVVLRRLWMASKVWRLPVRCLWAGPASPGLSWTVTRH
jgi:RHS repeat-associated protein